MCFVTIRLIMAHILRVMIGLEALLVKCIGLIYKFMDCFDFITPILAGSIRI
jgi:hypothetical protein